MNKFLASLFAVAALSLATSAFALDAAKVTEPVKVATKAVDKVATPTPEAKVEATKVEEVKAAEPAKKHHRKHAKKAALATPATDAK